MKQVIALFLMIALLGLTGCEAMKGLGKDMQNAGNWVEKKAEESK